MFCFSVVYPLSFAVFSGCIFFVRFRSFTRFVSVIVSFIFHSPEIYVHVFFFYYFLFFRSFHFNFILYFALSVSISVHFFHETQPRNRRKMKKKLFLFVSLINYIYHFLHNLYGFVFVYCFDHNNSNNVTYTVYCGFEWLWM